VRLFYSLCILTLVSAVIVGVYDLFQAEIEETAPSERIVCDPQAGTVVFEKPAPTVRIVYASMFGPGEPFMRVRGKWLDRFEVVYSERLSAEATARLTDDERAHFYARRRRHAVETGRKARARLDALQGLEQEARQAEVEALVQWLDRRDVAVSGARERPTFDDLNEAVHLLERLPTTLAPDAAVRPEAPAPRPEVRAPVRVIVERRWQGRWVLSTNRPRFLTGREVPDIIVGSKMELYALAQDDYAVALNEPLPGESVAPLDTPDSWGDPRRRWRDAFIPAMLEEGKYAFMEDKHALKSWDGQSRDRRSCVYLAPMWCSTICMFYNARLFEKAGITTVPRTWPAFLDTCKRLKAAGIAPLTADQDVYSDMWLTWLVLRALGPEAWVNTMAGVPPDKPVRERRSDPPWTDERYQRVCAAIRELRDRGYFKEGFLGSTWPAAQGGFANGDAAMMICGSWLPQELAGYKDEQSEGGIKLRCFSFPQWPGGPAEDQTAAYAIVYGMMICRQGRATPHAIELVKYLSANDHKDLVFKNAVIGCVKEAAFPPDLEDIREDFLNARKVYSTNPTIFARRYNASTLLPLYQRFFRKAKGENGYMTEDAFLRILQEKTEAYLKNGGEEGYE